MTSSSISVAATPAKKAFLALLFWDKYQGRAVIAFWDLLVLTVGGDVFYHFFFPVPPIHKCWETTTLWLQVLKAVARGQVVSFCLI